MNSDSLALLRCTSFRLDQRVVVRTFGKKCASHPQNVKARRPHLLAATHSSQEVPEAQSQEYWLPMGELSTINRDGPKHSLDAYTCFGCEKTECRSPAGCVRLPWTTEPGGYLRQILNARVYDVAIETPLEVAQGLSEEMGVELLLKREDLQPVFSFKVRGAFNRLSQLTPEQLEKGVVCASAGNHAQGVALAASKLGCRATICMPLTASEIKVKAVAKLGGDIRLIGQTYAEAQTFAQQLAREEGLQFISAFDDPFIIAGTGTIGLEVLRTCTTQQLKSLHAIFVPVGGGGMIAGIAAYVKEVNPKVLIIGVEPTGANAMAISLARGQRVKLRAVDVFADGVAIKEPGAECFRLCRDLIDGILLVDNAAISAAVKDVFNETRTILEPAGAVAVAGAKAYFKTRPHLKGCTAVALTSGANINFDRLRLVAELADLGANNEAMLATSISGVPGTLKDLVDCASGVPLSITELRHRFTVGRTCHVLWSVGVNTDTELARLLERLNSNGFPTQDISGIEAAQVHLRHLVGGRARGSPDPADLAGEMLFSVDVPERNGAVRAMLEVISPLWNVTLFHYRKTGNKSSPVLLGLQIPGDSHGAFLDATRLLEPEGFTFIPLDEEAKHVLGMFLQ